MNKPSLSHLLLTALGFDYPTSSFVRDMLRKTNRTMEALVKEKIELSLMRQKIYREMAELECKQLEKDLMRLAHSINKGKRNGKDNKDTPG